MSTTAKLFIDSMPDLAEGAKRFVVDCKWSTTTAHLFPGGLELTDEAVITSLLYRHEAECGKCNTARLWQHADLTMRDTVEQTWDRLQELAMSERRN